MPSAGVIGKDSTVVPGHHRRFKIFSHKVRSTTATTFATASGKSPECIAIKEDFGDWPNSEGVRYIFSSGAPPAPVYSDDWRSLTSSDT